MAKFLSVAHSDQLIDQAVNAVENACADFSDVMHDEPALKSFLTRLFPPAAGAWNTESLGSAYVGFVGHPPRVSDVAFGAATVDVNSIAASGPLNSPVPPVHWNKRA